jgi:hypothetical protein
LDVAVERAKQSEKGAHQIDKVQKDVHSRAQVLGLEVRNVERVEEGAHDRQQDRRVPEPQVPLIFGVDDSPREALCLQRRKDASLLVFRLMQHRHESATSGHEQSGIRLPQVSSFLSGPQPVALEPF